MHCCPHNPQEALEFGLERMTQAGLKKTQPRLSLIALLTSLEQPASAEELHRQLSQTSAPSDLATVYRNLHTFCDLGLIEKLNFSDGSFRYEWRGLERRSEPSHHRASAGPNASQAQLSHHHHVICTSCKKIEPVSLCWSGPEEESLRAKGYREISHRLEFFALCPNCT